MGTPLEDFPNDHALTAPYAGDYLYLINNIAEDQRRLLGSAGSFWRLARIINISD
jgi:hypothetical protein